MNDEYSNTHARAHENARSCRSCVTTLACQCTLQFLHTHTFFLRARTKKTSTQLVMVHHAIINAKKTHTHTQQVTRFGCFPFSTCGYPMAGEVGGEGEVVSLAGHAAVVASCTHVINHPWCRIFGHRMAVCGTRHARARRDTHTTGTRCARFRSHVTFDRLVACT